MILSFSPFLSDVEDLKRLAASVPVTDTIVIDEPPPQEVDLAAKPQKASKKPAKKVVGVRHSERLQKASNALLPLRPINPQALSMTCMHILLYLI
jgi:hypothetical protein